MGTGFSAVYRCHWFIRCVVAGRVSRRKETDEACNGDDEDQSNNERERVGLHSFLPRRGASIFARCVVSIARGARCAGRRGTLSGTATAMAASGLVLGRIRSAGHHRARRRGAFQGRRSRSGRAVGLRKSGLQAERKCDQRDAGESLGHGYLSNAACRPEYSRPWLPIRNAPSIHPRRHIADNRSNHRQDEDPDHSSP
jgi:hypothetical protein